MRRIILGCVLLLVLGSLIAACGAENSSGQAGASGGAQTVNVELTEFAITLDRTSAQGGSVTFQARNKGTLEHELVVVKTELDPDKLPVTDGKIDESKIETAGEIKEFGPGETESKSFELAAGKYVLICNLPAHYTSGMYAAFAVR